MDECSRKFERDERLVVLRGEETLVEQDCTERLEEMDKGGAKVEIPARPEWLARTRTGEQTLEVPRIKGLLDVGGTDVVVD